MQVVNKRKNRTMHNCKKVKKNTTSFSQKEKKTHLTFYFICFLFDRKKAVYKQYFTIIPSDGNSSVHKALAVTTPQEV